MYGCPSDCLILIPFRPPPISYFILSLKCFSSDSDSCPHVGIGPLLQLPTCWGQVQSYSHSCSSPYFVCPTEFCVILYILFCWSCIPVHSQLVFCVHSCVWRCIADVSTVRDVLHVHLLLHHLVLRFSRLEILTELGIYYLSHRLINFGKKTLSNLKLKEG